MSKIGIYGGSFNPIHCGHIALAEQVLKELSLDEIWFVVSPQNPFKVSSTELMKDEERMNMVKTALKDHTKLIASDYEFHLPRPSYTWTTLQNLSKDYPEHEFTLLIGADNWASFNRWKNYDDIISHYQIAIYPRRDSPIDEDMLPPNVRFLKTALYNISGTDIRLRLRQGLSIADMVPDCIKSEVEKLYK